MPLQIHGFIKIRHTRQVAALQKNTKILNFSRCPKISLGSGCFYVAAATVGACLAGRTELSFAGDQPVPIGC
jgi:hypothetical protein